MRAAGDEPVALFLYRGGGVSSYNTIAERTRVELKIRNSRFIGTAIPVQSRDAAALELAAIRKEFWDATHNCYAWRLAPEGLEYRFSDDGEPNGSAGKPILFVLGQRGLVDLLVVVTRYFGGTKLGVGGLARAYGETAAQVLNGASIREVHATVRLRVFTPYEEIAAVRTLVAAYADRFEEEFRDMVHYIVDMRELLVEEFRARVTDISQGRAGVTLLEPSVDPPSS